MFVKMNPTYYETYFGFKNNFVVQLFEETCQT